jgi:hypothetical protein
MIQIPAVIERCAGIDVGKKELAVAVITGPADEEGEVRTRVRNNGTGAGETPAMADRRRLYQCGHGKHRLVLDSGEKHPGRQPEDRTGLCA